VPGGIVVTAPESVGEAVSVGVGEGVGVAVGVGVGVGVAVGVGVGVGAAVAALLHAAMSATMATAPVNLASAVDLLRARVVVGIGDLSDIGRILPCAVPAPVMLSNRDPERSSKQPRLVR
jgi:hypothetical protein